MHTTPKIWTHFSWWLLPLAWMGLIYWFSAQSHSPGSELYLTDFLLKKFAHMFIFAGLFWSWWRAFQAANCLRRHTWLWILLFCLLYALLDEWHQSFVPGRTATLRDVGFDSLGALLACAWSYRYI